MIATSACEIAVINAISAMVFLLMAAAVLRYRDFITAAIGVIASVYCGALAWSLWAASC